MLVLFIGAALCELGFLKRAENLRKQIAFARHPIKTLSMALIFLQEV